MAKLAWRSAIAGSTAGGDIRDNFRQLPDPGVKGYRFSGGWCLWHTGSAAKGGHMPILRDLVLRLMPEAWVRDAERSSRLWLTKCTRCGATSNVWDLGGLRWRAAGRPLTLMRCTGCGKPAMQRISKP